MRALGSSKEASSRDNCRGFTFLEVALAIALLGILVAFAFSKLYTPGGMTIITQVSSAADLVRRAQALALTHGKQTRVIASTITRPDGTVSGTLLQLQLCTAGGSCTNDTSFATEQSVAIPSTELPVDLRFNTLGQPISSTGTVLTVNPSFTLRVSSLEPVASGASAGQMQRLNLGYRVSVSVLTGRVTFTSQ